MNPQHDDATIVFFDGVCNLCNHSVQWIIKRDQRKQFYFASLQSTFARDFMTQHPRIGSSNSVILWHKGKYRDQSDAVLSIVAILGFPWNILMIGKILPRSFRNLVYQWIAKNRYRWFGKRDTCMIPSPDLNDRFLDAAV